jgi:hypothetical protein
MDAPIDPKLIDAISRAIVRSMRGQRPWTVCIRSPGTEDFITLNVGSYKDVQDLAGNIRELGYRLKMMHPEHTHCDFLLEPEGAES